MFDKGSKSTLENHEHEHAKEERRRRATEREIKDVRGGGCAASETRPVGCMRPTHPSVAPLTCRPGVVSRSM